MTRLFFQLFINTSTNNVNEDLKKINDWVTQWKMSFNSDPTKQEQEVISRKIKKRLIPPLNFTIQMSNKLPFKNI